MVQVIVLLFYSLFTTPVDSATTFDVQEFIAYAKPTLKGGMQKQYAEWIMQAAYKYHENPALIASIIMVESSFDADAVGPMGEIGLMQLRPKFFGADRLLLQPKLNIFKGVKYVSQLRIRHWDQYRSLKFIEHYNCGSACKPVTFKYYNRVMQYYRRLRSA